MSQPSTTSCQQRNKFLATNFAPQSAPAGADPPPGPPLLPPPPPSRQTQYWPPQCTVQDDGEWPAFSGMSPQVLAPAVPPAGPPLHMGLTGQSCCSTPQMGAASNWGQGRGGRFRAAEQVRHGAVAARSATAGMQPPLPPSPPPPPVSPPPPPALPPLPPALPLPPGLPPPPPALPPPPLDQPCCRLPPAALPGITHVAPMRRGAAGGTPTATWGVPQSPPLRQGSGPLPPAPPCWPGPSGQAHQDLGCALPPPPLMAPPPPPVVAPPPPPLMAPPDFRA